MTHLVALVWITALFAACRPVSNPSPSRVEATHADRLIRDSGEPCFQPPYPEDSGVRTGQRAQVIRWNFGLDVRANPDKPEIVGRLNPGERVAVLEGPFCWRIPRTSNNRADHRLWRVRSETGDIEGWIDEYNWSLLTDVRYTVVPLDDDDPGIVVARPLSQPVQFSSHLTWTDIFGPLEPRRGEHTFRFGAYGYITIELEADSPDLTDPDVLGGTSSCRVVVQMYAEQGSDEVTVIGGEMRVYTLPVDRLWVEPGEYRFLVELRYIPGAGSGTAAGDHPTCPDTSYTLTLAPAPGS